MSIKLASEIIDAANDIGNTIRKRKKHIEWQKQIKHLLISYIKFNKYHIVAKS